MDNPRFNVGDEVVALETTKTPQAQQIIKDEIYTVEAIQYCSKCGVQDVNVGFSSSGCINGDFGLNVGCECGNEYPHQGLDWSYARKFAFTKHDRSNRRSIKGTNCNKNMNVNINKIIAAYKLNNPGVTTLYIATGLFPDLKGDQPRQTLSRICNGERQKVFTADFIIKACEFFEISPNDFFNYE